MAMRIIEESQRKSHNGGGVCLPNHIHCRRIVSFGIHDRLITGNAAETARNILAHEGLFRVGIAGDLIYCTGVVVLLTAVYVILQAINRGLCLACGVLEGSYGS